MELIRISDRKLKIMLTPSDMQQFELNADTFGEDSAEMHRTFRLLLEEIKKRTDFDADDQRFSVQYFPSREGGCEMFISHLSSPMGDTESEAPSAFPVTTSLCLQKGHAERGFHREVAYRFSTLTSLLHTCQRLRGITYIGTNSAYSDERGYYFLFISFLSSSPFTTPEELNFIVEYGSIENTAILKLYLREHGKVICEENAIHQLGTLI
ncbi:MAG: adaptor protein MecA [Ruminococcaceae bacterium]|nr:adaptor protein MecA [Oscillospiraceae bacterium]